MATPDNSIAICIVIALVLLVELFIHRKSISNMKLPKFPAVFTTFLIVGIVVSTFLSVGLKIAAGVLAIILTLILTVYWIVRAIRS